ncbi:MAG: hypothetical protein DI622_16120 [Chryseobacterium sp.]|nr:MAG: hypothetical protein DI622_16120 [Chryseobacterium sp.]
MSINTIGRPGAPITEHEIPISTFLDTTQGLLFKIQMTRLQLPKILQCWKMKQLPLVGNGIADVTVHNHKKDKNYLIKIINQLLILCIF